jgi:hypothetical protein
MHCYNIEYPSADKAESLDRSEEDGPQLEASLRLPRRDYVSCAAVPPAEQRPHKMLSMRVSDMPIAVCSRPLQKNKDRRGEHIVAVTQTNTETRHDSLEAITKSPIERTKSCVRIPRNN